ncbi:hypothetical protein AVEN_132398-1, partial [Araneus ventricosus]
RAAVVELDGDFHETGLTCPAHVLVHEDMAGPLPKSQVRGLSPDDDVMACKSGSGEVDFHETGLPMC